jgi:hypothetical protein
LAEGDDQAIEGTDIQHLPEIGDGVLVVAVHHADPIVARRRDAGSEGGAIAAIFTMMDDAHDPGMLARQFIGDLARTVRRAVVGDDDLEVGRVPLQQQETLFGHDPHRRLVVEDREEKAHVEVGHAAVPSE